MPNGVTLQAQSPGTAHADLGFWLQSQIVGHPVAMREAHLDVLVEQIAANRFTLPRNQKTGARITEKGTAIVEVHGILINRYPVIGAFWGMTSYEGLGEQFRRLATDTNVKRIVLDVNSPGGLVAGCQTCAEALEDLAETKPVYAIAHDMACSAGYWLACIADEISVSPDGDVGSIGVRGGHVSYARRLDREGIDITTFKAGAAKADFSINELLTPAAAAEIQYQIDRQHDRFVAHVARFRPLTEDRVRATDARCWVGQEAIEEGLADRVETLEALVERIERGAPRVKPRRKPKVESGSKSRLAPASRNPAPSVPADEVPAAGKTKGAKLMTHQVAAEGQIDPAALTAAIVGYTAGLKAQSAPAPAAAPAAQAAAEPAKADVAAEATARIFAILDCEEAKDKPKLARTLAGNAKLSVDEAKALLASAAAEKSEAASEQAQLGSALAAAMAKPGNAAAIKPDAAANKERPDFVAFAAATAKKRG